MFLEAEGISRRFYLNGKEIKVLERVSIQLACGKTTGLLGNSGSGKTTLGQILAGLQQADGGRIYVDKKSVSYPYKGELRRKIQILFQQPEASFNPRWTLWQSMREPYRLQRKEISRERLCRELEPFGLYAEHLERYPRELSGGELQRAALARILVLEPEVIVLDEPTSMLDSVSQAQMIGMLDEVQRERGVSYLFISHDRELAECFCHRMYVIESGIVKEDNTWRRNHVLMNRKESEELKK